MSAVAERSVTEADTLGRLADSIRRHHKAVERHARSMLDEAIAAGEALIEAKGLLKHGEFGPWLTYCGVNRRSASLYMKLAREKGNVAVLEADSIRAALDALAGKPRTKPNPPDFGPFMPAKSAAWQVERWMEAMAAQGRSEEEIRARVKVYLNPAPAVRKGSCGVEGCEKNASYRVKTGGNGGPGGWIWFRVVQAKARHGDLCHDHARAEVERRNAEILEEAKILEEVR